MDNEHPPDRRILLGVFVVCFANLLFEVVLTRLYSATMYYHFTFMAIALALFGLGASGVYVYLRSDHFTAERAPEHLALYAKRFAYASILTLAYTMANPIEILIVVGSNERPRFTNTAQLQMFLLVGITALPFFFSGMVVSLAITHYRRFIGRVYSYDLAGAALAAAVVGLLISWLGGVDLALLVAVVAVGGAVLFKTPRGWSWLPLALVPALFAYNVSEGCISVPTVKGVRADKTRFEEWNIFSRVTVDDTRTIKIDASAATAIAHKSHIESKDPTKETSALALSMFEQGPGHVLIIGPGGGRDVVLALAGGAKKVTGVEVNPIIAESIMGDAYAGASGNLYADPRINIVTDEGRSFLRRSTERYDMIQASLVDTWAATAAGAFALTENTLYTVEAFDDYYEHLTDGGAITMTRWHTGARKETARLLLLAAGALEKRGVPPGQTRSHIFYAYKRGLGTLVAKRIPLSDGEIDRLEAGAKAAGMEISVSPRKGTGTLSKLVDAGAWSAAVRAVPEDVSPPTDDRPFFFYFAKPGEMLKFRQHLKGELENSTVWLVAASGAVTILAIAFILLPLLVHRFSDLRGGGPGSATRRLTALVFFASIGFGFMVLEIALLQKLAFFLGHPSYALIVVLFAILIGSALGARFSEKISDEFRGKGAAIAAAAVLLFSLVFALLIAPAFRSWVAWPTTYRIVISGLLVFTFGGVLGAMVPIGVRLVSERDAVIVPWCWGVNGVTSVMGTVLATVIAIHLGFSTTVLVGALFYILAGLSALFLFAQLRRNAPVAVAEHSKDESEE